MKNLLFFCLLFFIAESSELLASVFAYPVAVIDEDHLLLLQQNSLDDLELYCYGLRTGLTTKELSAMYLPSAVKVLPGGDAFSFVDRGRLRIKKFCRRSPKTIDIIEPIGSISSVNWLDDESFYFEAKLAQSQALFLCDFSDGQVLYLLAYEKGVDFSAPCKVGGHLFSILKQNGKCRVVMFDWNPRVYSRLSLSIDYKEELISCDEQICFLHMKNESAGFYLKSIPSADRSFLRFSCCSLLKEDFDQWSSKDLFSFSLPLSMLIGDSDERFYESISPFLPNYQRSSIIYFMDYDVALQSVCLNRYDMQSGLSGQITNTLAMSPICCESKVYYGGKAAQAFKDGFNFMQTSFYDENEAFD